MYFTGICKEDNSALAKLFAAMLEQAKPGDYVTIRIGEDQIAVSTTTGPALSHARFNAEAVTKRLIERGLTQAELARELDIQLGRPILPGTVSRWLTQKQKPRQDVLMALSAILDLDISAITR